MFEGGEFDSWAFSTEISIFCEILEEHENEENEEPENSDDDTSEGEFVPSSWNSTAQPQRSALKSPDKSNEVRIIRIFRL